MLWRGNRQRPRPEHQHANRPDWHVITVGVAVTFALAILGARLFSLAVLAHDFYSRLAENQHGAFAEFYPDRGSIWFSDPKSPEGRYPAAVNKSLWLAYAEPRQIADAAGTAAKLAPILKAEEPELVAKLAGQDDPYEPLAHRLDDPAAAAIRELKLPGIGLTRENFRFYPDSPEGAHLVGFVGSDQEGRRLGRYGIEGYWEKQLAGESGFVSSETDPLGRWIGAAGRDLRPAKDGDEITLTVDRTIQHVACGKLRDAVAKHGATGGSVVILEPKTGAILAMCGMPDFDANVFSAVTDMRVFNNPVTFTQYEPGSIFKPIVMAAAIDAGAVSPNTTYEDEGSLVIGQYTIKNSDGVGHGLQTMTQVLEKSLNTGVIWAARRLGAERFREYAHAFGFGEKTGIDLDTEAAGDISSLARRGDIWLATASFGQGVSATPLQMAAAYAAIANGGKLMRPYAVAAVKHADGTVEKAEPEAVRQVIAKRAATLVGGMLVRVVEAGHGKRAGVPGYFVAGKTGTAQIPRADGQGYEEHASIGSFAGFAPVDRPAFVMVVKLDRPQDVEWAEASAAPLFGDIAKFLLQYMEIPPERRL
ncbi:hypothetical protein A3C96_03140 [Candidatus Uhrbacteria bacterium RIFCSPHIGHO2_02_FULL_60_10]|uniref:Penicillin-binding protein transpeptidase domain-containing protein n=1 Tax=Candidatus Uhrbacteria bacterium RIFCSPHIGHO2_02_FULL_60_10 TaxID=1802392 RepID=A0A1F7U727_9BACT|nr:MAG: hypothetical protein A3C96_03140 [Candidatus Uhrbacteria bacterium RIFCSPHIGHO2_02_FULL_60_10]